MFIALLLFVSKNIFTKNQFKQCSLLKNDSSVDFIKSYKKYEGYDMTKLNETSCDFHDDDDNINEIIKINFMKLKSLQYLQNQNISLIKKINYIENCEVFNKTSMIPSVTAGGLFNDWDWDFNTQTV
jgi:hypothetical protein